MEVLGHNLGIHRPPGSQKLRFWDLRVSGFQTFPALALSPTQEAKQPTVLMDLRVDLQVNLLVDPNLSGSAGSTCTIWKHLSSRALQTTCV